MQLAIIIFWFILTAIWGTLFFIHATEPWQGAVTALCVAGVVYLKIRFLIIFAKANKPRE